MTDCDVRGRQASHEQKAQAHAKRKLLRVSQIVLRLIFTCTINTLGHAVLALQHPKDIKRIPYRETFCPLQPCWCCMWLIEPVDWCCLQGLCWSDSQNVRKCRFLLRLYFVLKICRLLDLKGNTVKIQIADLSVNSSRSLLVYRLLFFQFVIIFQFSFLTFFILVVSSHLAHDLCPLFTGFSLWQLPSSLCILSTCCWRQPMKEVSLLDGSSIVTSQWL